jgi:myo-inositol-1(or 4)-monophosphatase
MTTLPQAIETIVRLETIHLGTVHPRDIEVKWKGVHNPVTQYDKATERAIRNALWPHKINIVGEEYGGTPGPKTAYIDPIDGTKSFMKGEFGCSVSVGVANEKELYIGAVGDIRSQLLYFAAPGEHFAEHIPTGTRRPLYSTRQDLPTQEHGLQLTIATRDKDGTLIELLDKEGFDIRRSAAIALQLALVAAGVTDCLIYKPAQRNIHDFAGGLAMVQYAANEGLLKATDYAGKPLDYKNLHNGLIIAPPNAHAKLLSLVA